jgi:hypothetical protein
LFPLLPVEVISIAQMNAVILPKNTIIVERYSASFASHSIFYCPGPLLLSFFLELRPSSLYLISILNIVLLPLSICYSFFRIKAHRIYEYDDRVYLERSARLLRFDPKTSSWLFVSKFHGSQPLVTCIKDGTLFYGSYFRNPYRLPVPLSAINLRTSHHNLLRLLPVGRHVHSIIHDSFSKVFYCCVGDIETESCIIRFDENWNYLGLLNLPVSVSRCIALVPLSEHIIFASDNPDSSNSINLYHKETGMLSQLCEISGPVYSVVSNADSSLIVFSSSIERAAHRVELVYISCNLSDVDTPRVSKISVFKQCSPKVITRLYCCNDQIYCQFI